MTLEEYKQNLNWIIDYITETWGFSKGKIILINAPKMVDNLWVKTCEQENFDYVHFSYLVDKHAEACADFAKQKSIHCVNMNQLMDTKPEGYEELLNDGLHLSVKGSWFLYDNIRPLIDRLILNDLKMNYPESSAIDEKNLHLSQ